MAEQAMELLGGGSGGSVDAITDKTPPTPEIATNNNTHAYISRIRQREENLFLEEYYSSTDITIKFDDEEQTEIGYIQYAMQEQLKPIYGYASRTWDDVAVGNRIVTGVLKVPIRNVYARNYDSPKYTKNTEPSKFIQYQVEQYGGDDIYNEKDQVIWQSESITAKNIPDWIQLTIAGGSVLQAIDPGYSNDFYSSSNGFVAEGSEEFHYRQMLQELGYTLNNGSSTYTFEQQIQNFQRDHGLSTATGSYGKLTAQTKEAIEAACYAKWAEGSGNILSRGTKLYSGPGIEYGAILTISNDAPYIVVDAVPMNGHTWQFIKVQYGGTVIDAYYCEEVCAPEEG